jgi:hypothetical protein
MLRDTKLELLALFGHALKFIAIMSLVWFLTVTCFKIYSNYVTGVVFNRDNPRQGTKEPCLAALAWTVCCGGG